MSKSASIGFDIGGTKTRLALLDEKLELIEDIKFRAPKRKADFITRAGLLVLLGQSRPQVR
jgi:predicted NBD/HSP70 family sugar kinase